MGRLDNRLKKANATIVRSREDINAAELAMETAVNSRSYSPIPLIQIDLNPNNLYNQLDNEEDIEELADAIEKNGLLHNIVVSERPGGRYLLLSGERRVRAIRRLAEKERSENEKRQAEGKNPRITKWDRVQAEILTGLDPIDELIILDEANLMARGGYSEESVVAKCMKRYMENIQERYGISRKLATDLLVKRSSYSTASVYRYIRVANDLIPELTVYFDNGTLPHTTALAYCNLNPEQQKKVAEALQKASESAEDSENGENKLLAMVIQKALRAAGAVVEEEREEILETLLDQPVAAEATMPATPAATDKRAKYIAKYNKMADDIHNMATVRKVKALSRMELAGGEGSIIESLDHLIEEATKLRDLVKGAD